MAACAPPKNADLAAGYAKVVVLSPFGGRSATLPAGQFEGLRKQGSRVEVITPDADSRAAMGTNQMDLSTRPPTARAGYRQAKALAEQLAGLWR
jgi:NTE family protein